MSSPRFRFKLLTREDMPLMHQWLSRPHVVEYWGKGATSPPTLEAVAHEYGEYLDGTEPIYPFIVFDEDDKPIGHVQWMIYSDYPAYAKILGIENVAEAANCDVFIGEESALYRGLGSALVRQFVDDVIFADVRVTTCFIDPEPRNKAAIRAYEKAGFTFVRDVLDDGEGGAVYLMSRARERK